MTAAQSTAERPRFKLKRPEIPESSIQAAVLEFLLYSPTVAWAHRMNSGGAHRIWEDEDGKQHKQYVKFAFRGCSDIIGQTRTGVFIAIECKRRTGRGNDDQKAFVALVRRHGGLAGFARSIDDAQAILRGEIRD